MREDVREDVSSLRVEGVSVSVGRDESEGDVCEESESEESESEAVLREERLKFGFFALREVVCAVAALGPRWELFDDAARERLEERRPDAVEDLEIRRLLPDNT